MNALESQTDLLATDAGDGVSTSVIDARFGTLFTRRLRRLVAIRRDHNARMNEHGLRLLDRAIYSTYCDCLDLGVGADGLQALRA